jgi:hypothetical protein
MRSAGMIAAYSEGSKATGTLGTPREMERSLTRSEKMEEIMFKLAIVAASVLLSTAAFAQGTTQKSGPGQSEFAPGHQTNTKGPGHSESAPGQQTNNPVLAIPKARRVSNQPLDRPPTIEQKDRRLITAYAFSAAPDPRRPGLVHHLVLAHQDQTRDSEDH